MRCHPCRGVGNETCVYAEGRARETQGRDISTDEQPLGFGLETQRYCDPAGDTVAMCRCEAVLSQRQVHRYGLIEQI